MKKVLLSTPILVTSSFVPNPSKGDTLYVVTARINERSDPASMLVCAQDEKEIVPGLYEVKNEDGKEVHYIIPPEENLKQTTTSIIGLMIFSPKLSSEEDDDDLNEEETIEDVPPLYNDIEGGENSDQALDFADK